jgi:LacI family transcriptional regulator
VWCNPRGQSFERIIGDCQGVIARIISDELAEKLLQTNLPIVDVFCAHGRDDRFDGVDSDHNTIGRMAATYFISKRYSTMAFAGFKGVPFSLMRLQGFSDILQGVGLVPLMYEAEMKNRNQTFFNDEVADAVDSRKLALWLRTLPRHTALFAANDLMAAQISRLACESAIRIPSDLLLLGVDNDSQLCAFADTPISSIDPCAYEVGYSAARMLAALMRRKPAAKFHRVYRVRPGELVERASTLRHDISPEWLADALGFIDASLDRPLTTADIVAHVGLSHVAVGKMFRRKIGMSPQRYICKLKMETARRLLEADGSRRVKEVAVRLGFSSLAYFCNVYRQYFGHSPRD